MFGSIRLGSVLGITVRAHFLLVLLFGAAVVLSGHDALQAVLFATMWFGLVLLHELGHCVVARHFGIQVVDITLWPLGGMARMSEIPESSKIEGLVAIAGPLVNFALALVGLPVWWWIAANAPGAPIATGVPGDSWVTALFFAKWFLNINLAMGLFNLIPLFPTDGGRLLRAWLGRNGDWVGATESAVGVGRVISVALGVTGLIGIPPDILRPNYLLTLIAIYLWWVGAQELMAVRMRHARGPFRIFADFARRARMAERAAARANAAAPANAPEGIDARPEARDEAHGLRGYSEAEIGRLERWRGSLRNYKPE